MVLDGVVADRSVTWLGSERDKRRYFTQRLGDHLRDNEYPKLVFGRAPNVTVRYFPDKLPIDYERDRYRHTFIYLARSPSEGGHSGPSALVAVKRPALDLSVLRFMPQIA